MKNRLTPGRMALLPPLGVAIGLVIVVPRQDASASGDSSFTPQDRSSPSRLDVARASSKVAALCHDAGLGALATDVLVQSTTLGRVDPSVATLLTCALEAPGGSVCGDLLACAGAGMDIANPLGECRGSTLLRKQATMTTGSVEVRAISCAALGMSCFESELGAACGVGACLSGASYFCDGDVVVACVQGLSQRLACAKGMTCGRTKGSKVVDCVPTSGVDCAADTCDGTILKRCVRDSFGKGSVLASDCGAAGLLCATQMLKGGPVGACVPPAGGCDNGAAPTCKDGKISVCLAGKAEQVSCADVGLAGTCVAVQGSVGCQ